MKEKYDYRVLGKEWQVYSDGLIHICMCQIEESAKIITEALNKIVEEKTSLSKNSV